MRNSMVVAFGLGMLMNWTVPGRAMAQNQEQPAGIPGGRVIDNASLGALNARRPGRVFVAPALGRANAFQADAFAINEITAEAGDEEPKIRTQLLVAAIDELFANVDNLLGLLAAAVGLSAADIPDNGQPDTTDGVQPDDTTQPPGGDTTDGTTSPDGETPPTDDTVTPADGGADGDTTTEPSVDDTNPTTLRIRRWLGIDRSGNAEDQPRPNWVRATIRRF